MASYWDQRARRFRDMADTAIGTEANYGERGSNDFLTRAEGFDASKAVNQYAQGAWGSISEALGAQLRGLQGNTRSGRFDSGFFDADKGVLMNNATRQLSDAVSRGSLEAAGLDLRNTESLAGFGEHARQNEYDLSGDERQLAEDTSREEAARRRKSRSGIGSAIGGVLGGIVGGPGGATIGGAVGGAWGG